jgi:hypothetical protein
MLSWDFSFEEMAMDTNWQMWKEIKNMVVTKIYRVMEGSHLKKGYWL